MARATFAGCFSTGLRSAAGQLLSARYPPSCRRPPLPPPIPPPLVRTRQMDLPPVTGSLLVPPHDLDISLCNDSTTCIPWKSPPTAQIIRISNNRISLHKLEDR